MVKISEGSRGGLSQSWLRCGACHSSTVLRPSDDILEVRIEQVGRSLLKRHVSFLNHSRYDTSVIAQHAGVSDILSYELFWACKSYVERELYSCGRLAINLGV